MSERKILVTGCAGFIGAKVSEFLLNDGYTVVGLDNMNDAYDVRLKQWRLDQIKNHTNFKFYKIDICNRQSMSELFITQSIDAIINLAARAGVRQSVEDPWIYFETNVNGTLNLLEFCNEFGVKKFVQASSSSVYGNNDSMPWREDQDTNHPLSPYAASKKASESLCYSYHYLYDIDLTVFRYFTVYGPAGRPDMSPFRFVQWIAESKPVVIYGNGKQSRDFTYVDDVARGTIAGLKPMGYEIINLGSDQPIELMDTIQYIEELLGKKVKLDFRESHISDVPYTWARIEKAEKLLNWKSQVKYEEGARSMVDWYLENRDWARQITTI